MGFSSWAADAIYNRFLVNQDKPYVTELLPDLLLDYGVWETEKKLPSGFFWQSDVKDGMEETISGGRRVKNARPTINSYMYGNAEALKKISMLSGDIQLANLYKHKADSIKNVVQSKLWNSNQHFFETFKTK